MEAVTRKASESLAAAPPPILLLERLCMLFDASRYRAAAGSLARGRRLPMGPGGLPNRFNSALEQTPQAQPDALACTRPRAGGARAARGVYIHGRHDTLRMVRCMRDARRIVYSLRDLCTSTLVVPLGIPGYYISMNLESFSFSFSRNP